VQKKENKDSKTMRLGVVQYRDIINAIFIFPTPAGVEIQTTSPPNSEILLSKAI